MAVKSITCDGEAMANFTLALLDHAKSKMANNAALLSIVIDVQEICLPGFDLSVWNDLAKEYKQAWLGEIRRRLGLLKTAIKGSEHETAINKIAKLIFSDAALAATAIDAVCFTQFGINDHFQTSYKGQPDWLASKDLVKVAPVLRGDPDKSLDMRLAVYLHGGKWVTLNNRGFALHCLASVAPKRLAPTATLGSEEAKRFNLTRASLSYNFSDSAPADRRKATDWEATIPTTVIAVISGRNGTDVVCTIKADWNKDAGNEKVFNSMTHATEGASSKDSKDKVEHKVEGKK